MTAEEYLVRMRETYVERYRSALRERRREGFDCTPEVWVDPNVPPGEPKPPHPLCIDIIVQGKDGPSMVM